MSFSLLKELVIDTDLCIKCGLCAKGCKHIEIDDKEIPEIQDYCIMNLGGLKCGLCFQRCPSVKKNNLNRFIPRDRILSIINQAGSISMKELVNHKDLPYDSPEIRYHALRLVQMKKVKISREISNGGNNGRYPVLNSIH